MPNPYWILLQDGARFRIARVQGESATWCAVEGADDTPEIYDVSAIAEALDQAGYRGEGVSVLLDSATCMAAQVLVEGRGASRNHKAMSYALEEYLPIAAEDSVADFVVSGSTALGVAADLAELRELLDELAIAGILVNFLRPAATVALAWRLESVDSNASQLVIWQFQDNVDLLLITSGRLKMWRSFSADESTLATELNLLMKDQVLPESVTGCGLEDCLQAVVIASCPTAACEFRTDSKIDAAAIRGGREAAGEARSWFDLTHSELHTGDALAPIHAPLRFAALSAAVLLVCLTAALMLRAFRYERLAEAMHSQQQDVFRETLPGQRVPIGVRSRLEREHQRLAGVTGRSKSVPLLNSALLSLRDALSGLPVDIRFRLLEARFDGNHVSLDAEIRGHGDADLLAAALRKAGFDVTPPHTEKASDRTVSVRLLASRSDQQAQDEKE
jgi:hypothetical protein